jgi:hypothetical protein
MPIPCERRIGSWQGAAGVSIPRQQVQGLDRSCSMGRKIVFRIGAGREPWPGVRSMKLSRLFQPRNPRFWLMVVLNLLSTALAWVARTYDLVPLAALMVAGFAVANAVLGIRLALALMREGAAR